MNWQPLIDAGAFLVTVGAWVILAPLILCAGALCIGGLCVSLMSIGDGIRWIKRRLLRRP